EGRRRRRQTLSQRVPEAGGTLDQWRRSSGRYKNIGAGRRQATPPQQGTKLSNVEQSHDGVRITKSRTSVMLSIAQRIPSRPKPLSLLPPYGIWSARQDGTSLIITPPTSSSSHAFWILPISRVKTPACKPKWLSFTAESALSK